MRHRSSQKTSAATIRQSTRIEISIQLRCTDRLLQIAAAIFHPPSTQIVPTRVDWRCSLRRSQSAATMFDMQRSTHPSLPLQRSSSPASQGCVVGEKSAMSVLLQVIRASTACAARYKAGTRQGSWLLPALVRQRPRRNRVRRWLKGCHAAG